VRALVFGLLLWCSLAQGGEAPAVISSEAIEAALAPPAAAPPVMRTRGLRIQARSEEARSEDARGAIDLQVAFALDSAVLLPEALTQLDQLAAALKSARLGGQSFELAGHTDSSGSARRNLELSRARATAVRDYLATAGVDAGALSVAGYGSERPLAGRSATDPLNRRVEIRTREKTP
jgi:outer membrane protein OmpA-like peptidoglycan-associated protein